MTGRTSTAVMARRVEPASSLDFFPTPPWATRAFCKYVLPVIGDRATAWDPACGEGHMALALEEYFSEVFATDIFSYGYGNVADFLHADMDFGGADWIITNPPFNVALEFIHKALRLCRTGVAMLVRMQFLEGEERYSDLFSVRPPATIAQFAERVPMHRGRWVITGTTATAYTWVVWLKKPQPFAPSFTWIPKSRQVLTRHDDWLRFSGCEDLPKDHAVMKLIEASRAAPVKSEAVRAEKTMELLL